MADAKIRFIGEDKVSPVNEKIKSSLKSTEKSFTGVKLSVSRLRNSLLLFSFAAGGTALVLRKIISTTSDLEESQQKFGVVFGNVSRDAVKANKDLQDAFNLSQETSTELLATTGDLLTGLGFVSDEALDLSVQINTLAGDLASFSNIQGGTTRASEIITKALLGEREALASLGVKITESDIKTRALAKGIKIVNGEIDRQEKSLITLALITEQSKNAIGDFDRSQTSFANQSKTFRERLEDLATVLGGAVLPAFGQLLGIVNKVLVRIIKLVQVEKLEERGVGELVKRRKEQVTQLNKEKNARNRLNIKGRIADIDKAILAVKKETKANQDGLAAEKAAAELKAKNQAKAVARAAFLKKQAAEREQERDAEIDVLAQELDFAEKVEKKERDAAQRRADEAAKETERQQKRIAERQRFLDDAPFREFGAAVGGVFQALETSISDAFSSLFTGAKSGAEIFEDFGLAVLSIIGRLIARLIVFKALTAALGPGGTLFGLDPGGLLGFQSPAGTNRTIPGPSSQAVPIIAHGGESIGRGGGGGVTIMVAGNVFNSEETLDAIATGLKDFSERTGVSVAG